MRKEFDFDRIQLSSGLFEMANLTIKFRKGDVYSKVKIFNNYTYKKNVCLYMITYVQNVRWSVKNECETGSNVKTSQLREVTGNLALVWLGHL